MTATPPHTPKELIRRRLIGFQKQIADLSFAFTSLQNDHRQWEKELYLELFEVLDAFENIFQSIEAKEQGWDKSARMAMQSFRSVYRKILRILSQRGVEQIEFPDNKAIFGLCKVVETKALPGKENEEILSVLRKGYRKKDGEVIRPAEVITVLNN
ncbi:MAG: nucleotide exchange factor GrpE [bacterium]